MMNSQEQTAKTAGNSRKKVFLTFDIEDIINLHSSISSLSQVLCLLEENNLRGLFFITGNIAEKIRIHPEILRRLELHDIGYHSTSHSVKPRIFEFTDVKSFDEAVMESLVRETSHVDPDTGLIKGYGGIQILKQIFPHKDIEAFRAPSFCWSPAHLEALKQLNIKFDFSTEILDSPFFHKGITFYPYPVLVIDEMKFKSLFEYLGKFLLRLFNEEYAVILVHPHQFMSNGEWDILNSNHSKAELKSTAEIRKEFALFLLFLRFLSFLQKIGIIVVTPKLEKSKVSLVSERINVQEIYRIAANRFGKFGNYKPRFLLEHFRLYFGCKNENAIDE